MKKDIVDSFYEGLQIVLNASITGGEPFTYDEVEVDCDCAVRLREVLQERIVRNERAALIETREAAANPHYAAKHSTNHSGSSVAI